MHDLSERILIYIYILSLIQKHINVTNSTPFHMADSNDYFFK